MIIKPCFRCPISEGCEIRTAKTLAVKGLGFTIIKFRCEKQREYFSAGMRVEVRFPYVCSHVDRNGDGPSEQDIQGVFVRWRPDGKCVVWFPTDTEHWLEDKDGNPTHFGVCWPRLIKPIGGDNAPVCSKCGVPEEDEDSDRFCSKCGPGEEPRGY